MRFRTIGSMAPGRTALGVPEIGRLVLILVHLLLVGAALWIGYFLRFHLELFALAAYPMAPLGPYLKVFVLLAATILVLCRGAGLYRIHGHHSPVEETAIIAKAVTLATGFVLVVTFFYRGRGGDVLGIRIEGFSYSRLVFAFFWVTCIALLAAAQAVFRRWQHRRYRRGLDLRKAILVGINPSYVAAQLARDPAFGLDVLGYVDADSPAKQPAAQPAPRVESSGGVGTLVKSARRPDAAVAIDLPCLGTLEQLGQVLESRPIEEVVLIDQGLSHRALLEMLDACERREVKVRMVLPIYDLLVGPEDLGYVRNVPLFRVDERRYHWLSRTGKRAFDAAISAALLLLLWPLFLLIVLAIRLESRGRALFVQVRAGEGGRPFGMFKFRTMVEDAESRLAELVDLDRLEEPVFKIADDPRVTRVGRILRRTSLDELPQLWNVLKGDMSLVGPRPEELRVADRYDVWQRRRLKVKPGITGLQQVEARGTHSELNERVRLDVYYIRKQSLLFDLVILLRTVWAVIRGRGAV
jgi:lipopolysaccharide/colanic/teichoic acid biosynthesis glycosyltransferase